MVPDPCPRLGSLSHTNSILRSGVLSYTQHIIPTVQNQGENHRTIETIEVSGSRIGGSGGGEVVDLCLLLE